jgi:hypothetical protein
VVVSPVTLRPRFNPNATLPGAAVCAERLPPEVDVRQMSLAGAAWTLGSLAQLSCCSAVHSLTLYETLGWRGVMETEGGSPLPDLFPSIPGAVFPLFHVLADVADYHRVRELVFSDPLAVAGFGLINDQHRLRILIANLRANSTVMTIEFPRSRARLRLLDANNAERAMRDPESFFVEAGEAVQCRSGALEIELPPFAIARLDEIA